MAGSIGKADPMTEQEAIEIAYTFAVEQGLDVADTLVTAKFDPIMSPNNIWKVPSDRWHVLFKYPDVEHVFDSRFFVVEVDYQTKAARLLLPL